MAYAKINSITNANMAKVSSAAKAALGKIGSIDAPATSNPFTFTVLTTSAGSASDTFVLPLVNDGTINFTVDWGDSSTDTITAYNQSEITHEYSAAGTYTIQMAGTIRGWSFNGGGDCRKMRVVSQWGDMNFTQNSAFEDCRDMTCTATDAPAINTTSFSQMFYFCEDLVNFGGAAGSWDMSGVTSLFQTFKKAYAFTGANIGGWDVGNVTSFYDAFERLDAFNPPNIGDWDVSKGNSFSSAFKSTTGNGTFDQDISDWDIGATVSFDAFLQGQTLSTANYDAILIAWEGKSHRSSVVAHFGNSTYTAGGDAAAARTALVNDDSWTITDGGTA